jgi:hypothetical protein
MLKKLLFAALAILLVSTSARAEVVEFTNEDAIIADTFSSTVELLEKQGYTTCVEKTNGVVVTMLSTNFGIFLDNIGTRFRYRCYHGYTANW